MKIWLMLVALLVGLFVWSETGEAMSRKPKTFQVEMVVDFGPAEKPTHQETLEVEKGMTAKEAVSLVFPIRSGKACFTWAPNAVCFSPATAGIPGSRCA